MECVRLTQKQNRVALSTIVLDSDLRLDDTHRGKDTKSGIEVACGIFLWRIYGTSTTR